jgi:hypothetical protein
LLVFILFKIIIAKKDDVEVRCGEGGCGGPSNSLRIRKNFPETWIFKTYETDK